MFVDAASPALCFAFCQVLAGRSDVMPDIWIDNLRTLEDSVPPIPVAQVCFALANSLEVFSLFSTVLQVIRATHRKRSRTQRSSNSRCGCIAYVYTQELDWSST
jgi:hypothetical protein